jgi:hypothetical protein
MDEATPLRRRIRMGNRASKGSRSEAAWREPSNFMQRLGIFTVVRFEGAAKARMLELPSLNFSR